MNAIQYTAFGDSSVLRLADLAQPSAVQADEICIQVHAASINPLDMKIRMGWMQAMMPIQLPYVPGLDAAGTVTAVGSAVTRFQVGDAVMASSFGGAYAEYAVVKASNAVRMPATLNFAEAAALVVPMGTAYSTLVQAAQLQAGQTLLLHGAAGAVGLSVLQWAKAIGATVIGTASGKGLDAIRELGVDLAVDYKTEDFTAVAKGVDVVIDGVGGETQARSFGCIKPGGRLISITTPPSQELAAQHGVTARFVSSNISQTSLEAGLALYSEGWLRPHVAATHPLEEAAQAQDRVSAGGLVGKVVLVMA